MLLSILMNQQCQEWLRWKESGGGETYIEAKLEKCVCEESHGMEDNDEGVDLRII